MIGGILPVRRLSETHGHPISPAGFVPAIASFYETEAGTLSALLLNASTLVLYASRHMTLFEGVLDQKRLPEPWPSDLPIDAPFAAITDHFTGKLCDLAAAPNFRLRSTGLGLGSSGSL